mgnify:CR=1 FL=1
MNNEIHINHITKRYGDVEALRDLSLEIGSGELFGVIGGAGLCPGGQRGGKDHPVPYPDHVVAGR